MVDTLVTAISDYSGELKQDLERNARVSPAVRIDLDPLYGRVATLLDREYFTGGASRPPGT